MRRALVLLLPLTTACAPLIDWSALDSADASSPGFDATSSPDARADVFVAPETGVDSAPPFDAGIDANPCLDVMSKDNGDYCGKTMQYSFAGGDPDVVYTCMDGLLTATKTCPDRDAGCFIAPPAYSDGCDECFRVHDGKWCGSEFSDYKPVDGPLLITCQNGAIVQTSPNQPKPCLSPTPVCHPADGGATCGT